MLAIALALFILASAALPAFAAEAGKADETTEAEKSIEDGGSEKAAEKPEEKSALDAKGSRRKLNSTDGADSSESGVTRSRKARIIDSADNKFILARDARQTSRIDGDYAAVGDDAEVSRGVGGDVFAAGRNVLVTDDEELQNVAVAGANVNVHVKNARNIYAAGGDIDIQADDGAKGIYVAGLSVALSGAVTDAYITAASANVSGTVAQNLTVRANNVTFDPDATVGGDITIISKKRPVLPASIDPSNVTYKAPGVIGRWRDGGLRGQTALQKLGLILTVSGIVAAVVLSLVLNAMRGSFFHERALHFRRCFWRDMLRGLAGVIVAPVLSVLLLVSVVGIPIGAISLVICAVALYLSPIVSGVILGRLIFPKLNRFGSGAIVTCLIWLLMLVPYLGPVVSIAAHLFGVGSLIAAIPPRRKKLLIHSSRDSEGGEHRPAENPA